MKKIFAPSSCSQIKRDVTDEEDDDDADEQQQQSALVLVHVHIFFDVDPQKSYHRNQYNQYEEKETDEEDLEDDRSYCQRRCGRRGRYDNFNTSVAG